MRRPGLSYVFVAVLAFAATRVVSLAGTFLAVPDGQSFLQLLTLTWDPRWYQAIAAHGYDDAAHLSPQLRVLCPDHTQVGCARTPDRHSNLAFFPLFPAAIRMLSSAGIEPLFGALVLATTASLVASALIALIARDVFDERAGVIAVALWGAMPVNVALSSGRPESLFVALAAGSLWLLARHPVWAAVLAALAGLTRFQAIAVIVPVMVAAWVRPNRLTTRLAVTAIAPLGLLAFLGLVAHRTGRLDGWLAVQQEWQSVSDWGASKVRFLHEHLLHGPPIFQVAAWTIVAACLLFVASLVLRLPWPLNMYSGLLLAGVIAQASYHPHSMRFLLMAFPLVFPLAAWGRRLPTWLAAVVLLGLCVASTAFQSGLWPNQIDF